MGNLSNNIVLSSTLKALNRATVYGRLETSKISLFNAVTYFIRNKEQVKSIKGDDYAEAMAKLRELSSALIWRYKDDLCSYKDLLGSELNIPENNPPTIDNYTVGNHELEYTFKVGDFLQNYRDRQNDSWNKLNIKYDSWEGTLIYNGANVNSDLTIDIRNLSRSEELDLVYIRASSVSTEPYNDYIMFRVSDDNATPLYSSLREVQIINQPLENQPPTIGDIGLIVDNNVTTVLTYDIFINQMDPSYTDPEGDDLDAIRIESISGNNKGVFRFKGIGIQVGDIISAAELKNGDLIHIGPTDNSINTDYFAFAVRDVGSLIWVI